MLRVAAASLVLALVALACAPAAAQTAAASTSARGEGPPNFFEVQQYDQPFAGWAEPTLWTTYVGRTAQREDHFGRDVPRQGLVAHSAEIEYGLTDRITIGGYEDFVDPHSAQARDVQTRLLARYRFSDRFDLPVNPAIYLEYYIPKRGYGDHELEARLIADRDIGDFRIVVNPTFSVATSGDRAGGSPTTGLSGGVYWRRPRLFQPGIEYFAEYGPWNHFADVKQYVLPTVDIGVTRNITWHLGVGFGLTRSSDHLVVESQLRFEFDVVRPSVLFGRRGD